MTFTARYPGTCDACTEHIAPGDNVRYAADPLDHESGVLIHDDCGQAQRPERPAVICGTCNLTKPCDCEDPR